MVSMRLLHPNMAQNLTMIPRRAFSNPSPGVWSRTSFVPKRCLSSPAPRFSSSIHSANRGRTARPTATLQLQSRYNAPSSPRGLLCRQFASSDIPEDPSRPRPEADSKEPLKRDVPSYELTLTCKPCKTRSTHRISKQGYHKGTVLITCPSCKNRHLISDHLQIFQDKAMTIDKFLEEQGEDVVRGSVGPDGGIEIWDKNTDDPTQGGHVGAPWPSGEKPPV